jgi:hypothetical protein
MSIHELKNDFRVYYLPWIKYWGIGMVLVYIGRGCDKILDQDDRDMSLLGFLPALGILFLLVMIIASIYYWHYKYYAPKRKRLILDGRNLEQLKDLGFNREEDFYHGSYKGYDLLVVASTDPKEGEWIEISTTVVNKFHPKVTIKELLKDYEVLDLDEVWLVKAKVGIIFGRIPEYEVVKATIDELIEKLVTQRFAPQTGVE